MRLPLLVIAAVLAAGAARAATVAELAEQGAAAYGAGRFAEAAGLYRQAIERRPAPELHLNLGHCLMRLKKHAEAAAAYRKALEADPKAKDGEWFLAQALLGEGKAEEAIALFRKALPARAEAWVWIGRAYGQLGDLVAAEAAYRQGAVGDPKARAAREALAVLCLRLGRFEEAERICTTLLRRFPGDAPLKRRLAEAQAARLAERASQAYQAEHFDQAAALYQQAIQARPSTGLLVNLGHCRLQGEDYEGAVAAYRKALADEPGLDEVQRFLGRALIGAGRTKDALEPLRKALGGPAGDQVALLLGQAHEQLGEGAAAEAVYRKAAGKGMEHRRPAEALGALLANSGRHDEAIAVYDALVRRHPRDAALAKRLAQVRAARAAAQGSEAFARSDYQAALRHFQASLDHFADADVLLNLGHTLQALRRYDDAIAAYRRAMKLAPGRRDIHWPLAQALYHAGELEAAIGEFRASLDGEPREEATVLIGRCFELLDDPALARTAYEQGILRFPASRAIREALAALHLRRGRPALAEPIYAALVRRVPADPALLKSLAQARIAAGALPRAIDALEMARHLAPDDPAVHQSLADLYLSRGMHCEAAQAYSRFLSFSPKPSAEDYYRLAHAWFRGGEMVSASDALAKALALDKANARCLLLLGHVLVRQDRPADAAAAYARAIQAAPDVAEAHAALAALHLGQKQYAEAARRYRAALELDATDPTVYRNAVIALVRSGDADGARSLLKQAVGRFPGHRDLADLPDLLH